MKKYYKIVDIVFEISMDDAYAYDYEGDLEAFKIEETNCDYKVHFNVCENLSDCHGDLIYSGDGLMIYQTENSEVRYNSSNLRIEKKNNCFDVEVKKESIIDHITCKNVLNALMMEHLLVEMGGFILHASFIEVNGKAILFTAPSGTGKSTQASLWKKYRNAIIHNGDRVAIKDGFAYGIPYSGSSKICHNISLPIACIVYLSQAPKTSISPLLKGNAFSRIWEGISLNIWNKQDVSHCADSLIQLLSIIPFYHLSCTPDQSAILALESELRKNDTK